MLTKFNDTSTSKNPWRKLPAAKHVQNNFRNVLKHYTQKDVIIYFHIYRTTTNILTYKPTINTINPVITIDIENVC